MLIRIHCPNPQCKKLLRIDARHAGKKISCAGCQQHIRLPTAEELKLSGKTTAKVSEQGNAGAEEVIDFDMLAAQAVDSERAEQAEVNKTEMVEFTCPHCDEQVKLSIENAGKRAPCPSCRRIVAVPKVDIGKPKDWREKEARIPTLAKKEEVKLEGAWGNQEIARVSMEALEEAKAIRKAERKLTTKDYIRYSLLALLTLSVLYCGWWGWSKYRAGSIESWAVSIVENGVKNSGLPAEMLAVLRRGFGEWKLLTGTELDQKKDGVSVLRSALTTTSDPLWNWLLARDIAEVAGQQMSLDLQQSAGPIDITFLIQLLGNVPSGEAQEEVLRVLCRSLLFRAQSDQKLMDSAQTILLSVIKQAIKPVTMSSAGKSGTAAQDFSDQLNGIGILAQELNRMKAAEQALRLVGKSANQGERLIYKKEMPVPRSLVAAVTALSAAELEINKEKEQDAELGKMIGHFLAQRAGPANELYQKRREAGFAEVNLLPFLELAQCSLDDGKLQEAQTYLNQAMSIAQIYTSRNKDVWRQRIYAHVKLCEMTAQAGNISLAETRVKQLKLEEYPGAAQVAMALIARQRDLSADSKEGLLAGLPGQTAGQAWAAYSIALKQSNLTRNAYPTVTSAISDEPGHSLSVLGGLLGFRIQASK